MADFEVSGRMKVKSLSSQFKKEFGSTLRVYHGKKLADDNDTLASIRTNDDKKGGDVKLSANMLVKTVEEAFKKNFGITVQVATADNKKLADNASRISQVG